MLIQYLALICSTFAVVLALWAVAVALEKRPAPKVAQLRVEVADLTEAYERLQRNLRRMQMRINSEKSPGKVAEQPAVEVDETPEQWKKRMRLELARGKFPQDR